MKIQKIFRMQAIAIGVLGMAMLIPSHAAAQEISNTEWTGGPDTRLDQNQNTNATVAEVAVATPENVAPVTTEASVAVAATPVALAATFADMNASTQAWVISFALFVFMILVGIYCVLREFRRDDRNLAA